MIGRRNDDKIDALGVLGFLLRHCLERIVGAVEVPVSGAFAGDLGV